MGFGPSCQGNCGGSSQTLGNPPVTPADLSPPQPEDNRSAGSGGPGRLSAQPQSRQPCPPPLSGPVLLAPSPASIQPGPQNLPRPSPPQSWHTLLPALAAPIRDICGVYGESPTHWEHFHTGEIRLGENAGATFKEKSHPRGEMCGRGPLRKETLSW